MPLQYGTVTRREGAWLAEGIRTCRVIRSQVGGSLYFCHLYNLQFETPLENSKYKPNPVKQPAPPPISGDNSKLTSTQAKKRGEGLFTTITQPLFRQTPTPCQVGMTKHNDGVTQASKRRSDAIDCGAPYQPFQSGHVTGSKRQRQKEKKKTSRNKQEPGTGE